MTLLSVDVYSGSADSIVRDPNAKAVIVKATQGTGYVNPKCNHQWDLAGQLGRKRGLYHYAGGGNPVSEARYFIDNIKNYVGQGILILDWEKGQNQSWGNPNWCKQFANEVHRLTGVWPLIYVQESALNQVANCASTCGLWVAKYPSMHWYSWTVPNMAVSSGAFPFIAGWQFTGDNMDRSIWYLDEAGWDKYAKPDTANPKPAEQPKVDTNKPVIKPKQWVDDLGVTWTAENAKFTVAAGNILHLRYGASPSSSVISTLGAGAVIKYDAFARTNGFVYVRQPREGGGYGYVAVRNAITGEAYGTFS